VLIALSERADYVLAWQAGYVRTRFASVLAIDDSDPLSFSGRRPDSEGRPAREVATKAIELAGHMQFPNHSYD